MSDVMTDLTELNGSRAKVIEKVVGLQMLEVADGEICRGLAIGEDLLGEIRADPEFKRLISVAILEKYESNALIDNGWDSVEQLGISTVIDTLKWSKDPDFALRASAVANKAVRRKRQQGPTIQGNVGARSVIYLEKRFIEKVKDHNTGIERTVTQEITATQEIPKKDVNMMQPSAVERMMKPEGLVLPSDYDEDDVETPEEYLEGVLR